MISYCPAGSEILSLVISLLNFSMWRSSFPSCINMPPCSIVFRCAPWTHLLGFLEAAWRGTMTEGVVISYHLPFLSPSPFLPSSHFWVTWVAAARVGAQQSSRTSILGSESPCLMASRGHRFLQRHCHTPRWVSNLGRLVAQTSKGLNLSRACRSDLTCYFCPPSSIKALCFTQNRLFKSFPNRICRFLP